MKDTPWFDAIKMVLVEADGAIGCGEIAERIIEKGLRHSVGATPAQTVASIISLSMKEDGSPFTKAARGLYALTEQATPPRSSASTPKSEESDSAQTGALRAFGMYWLRDDVSWTGAPQMLGRQGAGASDVNFAAQVGVYLLHDRDRVIYVGRATDTLYARLRAHTTDRLSGRWDRFSWFGLRAVSDEGELIEELVPWTPSVVIETMEALLIESLEPPLNRRRGDNFSAVEFIQAADPSIARRRKAAILEEMSKSIGL